MHHPAFPSPRAARGFTLIELLTVVAIIGILAAILIPIIGSVKRSAGSARSVANLKQYGVAYLAFAADNQNRLPPAYSLSDTIGSVNEYGAYMKGWDYFLLPYTFPGTSYTNLPQNGENLSMSPNDLRTDTADIGKRRTYSANTGATPAYSADTTPAWTLLNSFKSPSRLILLVERPCGQGTIGGYPYADVTPSVQLRDIPLGFELNPGNRYNYLFADGHVGAFTFQQTMPTGQSVSNTAGATFTGTGAYSMWVNN